MLYELYSTLCQETPKDDGQLIGLPISEDRSIWLSIDHNAFPSLLLPSLPSDVRPDIVLRSIEVIFSRSCEISVPRGERHSGCYTIVFVKEADPDTVRLFAKILEERFCRVELKNGNAEIATNILELASLFSKIENSSKDLVGLWGELSLILRSHSTLAAVKSWSTQKTAKFDFVTQGFVLDVKTTLSTTPRHRFSIEQLRPNGNFDAYIASCRLNEAQSGRTVGELTDAVETLIDDPDTRSAFLNQCFEKGGKDIYRSKMRLQTYPDEGILALYRAPDIPVPQVDPKQPISNVRFDVDLTSIPTLDQETNAEILRFGA